MQRDIWLDNIINLWQYILQYNVVNMTSLRNITFHWLNSEYMQLASGFMQLAATGHRRNIVHFHCLFEGKMLTENSISKRISGDTATNENFEYSYPQTEWYRRWTLGLDKWDLSLVIYIFLLNNTWVSL